MTFTRRNAYREGGTFANEDLLWYAQAVGVMKSRPISDPTSWWFYAAIHKEFYKTEPDDKDDDYLVWKNIQSIPQAMLQTAPSESHMNQYWKQCTHGNQFFLPWHRGIWLP
jgi:tyrosinase